MKSSLNMSLYFCYYLRLNNKNYRKELSSILTKFFKEINFEKFPENEINNIVEQMTLVKSKGIALNRALIENFIYMLYLHS